MLGMFVLACGLIGFSIWGLLGVGKQLRERLEDIKLKIGDTSTEYLACSMNGIKFVGGYHKDLKPITYSAVLTQYNLILNAGSDYGSIPVKDIKSCDFYTESQFTSTTKFRDVALVGVFGIGRGVKQNDLRMMVIEYIDDRNKIEKVIFATDGVDGYGIHCAIKKLID